MAAPEPLAPPAAPVAPACPSHGRLLVELLVRDGHVSAEQARHAARVRAKLHDARSLIGVMMAMGAVDEERVLASVRQHRPNIPLGALLVELGYLHETDLRTALAQQEHHAEEGMIGDILLRKHLIKEHDLLKVLAAKLGVHHAPLDLADVEQGLLDQVTGALCRRWSMFPLRTNGESVTVAFVNPADGEALKAARVTFDQPVTPVLASAAELKAAIARLERLRERGERRRESGDATITASATDLVDRILVGGIDEGASDIHIEPLADRVRVRLRSDGVLREVMEFPRTELAAVTSRLKVLAEANITERRRHQDGRILYEHPATAAQVDLRASFYVTINGESAVLRVLNKKQTVLGLRDIAMAPAMLELLKDEVLDLPSGVFVVTGPTGSGKTTTLYSCVHYLNNDTTSIITAEDPVEYQVDGIMQCSINPKLDLTFDESLRHMVRQDPDIIVLGEIRDQFSAETAIQAALTGHKVLTTFHTEDTTGALLRLLNMGVEPFLIASTVSGVLAQRLLRKVCEECAEPVAIEAHQLKLLGWSAEHARGGAFQRGRGCHTCHFTGYRGRLPVFELLVPGEAVRDALMIRSTAGQIRRLCQGEAGTPTLLEDGLVKAARGETTVDEILRHLPRFSRPRALPELRRLAGNH